MLKNFRENIKIMNRDKDKIMSKEIRYVAVKNLTV